MVTENEGLKMTVWSDEEVMVNECIGFMASTMTFISNSIPAFMQIFVHIVLN